MLATVLTVVAIFVSEAPPAIVGVVIAAQLFLWAYNAPVNAILVNSVEPGLRARAFGLSILCIHLAGDVLSPPLIGLVSDATGRLDLALGMVPVAVLIGGVAWLYGWRTLPAAPPPRPHLETCSLPAQRGGSLLERCAPRRSARAARYDAGIRSNGSWVSTSGSPCQPVSAHRSWSYTAWYRSTARRASSSLRRRGGGHGRGGQFVFECVAGRGAPPTVACGHEFVGGVRRRCQRLRKPGVEGFIEQSEVLGAGDVALDR